MIYSLDRRTQRVRIRLDQQILSRYAFKSRSFFEKNPADPLIPLCGVNRNVLEQRRVGVSKTNGDGECGYRWALYRGQKNILRPLDHLDKCGGGFELAWRVGLCVDAQQSVKLSVGAGHQAANFQVRYIHIRTHRTYNRLR